MLFAQGILAAVYNIEHAGHGNVISRFSWYYCRVGSNIMIVFVVTHVHSEKVFALALP
jgi:hypothetical protein